MERELVWDSITALKEGIYYAFVEIEWKEGTKWDFYYVSTYSDAPVKLKDVTDKHSKRDILDKMLISCAEKKTQKYEYQEHKQSSGFKINLRRAVSVQDTGWDYGYIYYANDSPAAVLSEELNFDSLDGYSVDDSLSPSKIKVDVNPNWNRLILIKRHSDTSKFSVGFKSKIIHETNDLVKNIKKQGKKNQIKAYGKDYNIFFYILDHSDGYIFKYENLEKSTEFSATFKFELENLEIDEETSKIKRRKEWAKSKENDQPDSWKIHLKPGEEVIKRLKVINDYSKIGFRYDYTFKVIDSPPKLKKYKSTMTDYIITPKLMK
jgi:hypothetical protein